MPCKDVLQNNTKLTLYVSQDPLWGRNVTADVEKPDLQCKQHLVHLNTILLKATTHQTKRQPANIDKRRDKFVDWFPSRDISRRACVHHNHSHTNINYTKSGIQLSELKDTVDLGNHGCQQLKREFQPFTQGCSPQRTARSMTTANSMSCVSLDMYPMCFHKLHALQLVHERPPNNSDHGPKDDRFSLLNVFLSDFVQMPTTFWVLYHL